MRELTPQQEAFCQLYFVCKRNASEAYRQAYDCSGSSSQTIWANSHQLKKEAHVAHRIQELEQYYAELNKVTVETLTEELNEAKEKAYNFEQASAAVSAIVAKGKLHGLLKESSVTSVTIEDRREKTEEEIREELKARGLPVDNIFKA